MAMHKQVQVQGEIYFFGLIREIFLFLPSHCRGICLCKRSGRRPWHDEFHSLHERGVRPRIDLQADHSETYSWPVLGLCHSNGYQFRTWKLEQERYLHAPVRLHVVLAGD